MKSRNEYKDEICQCRKCNNVFHQSQLASVHNEIYDQEILEKVCPECFSSNYGLINYYDTTSINGVYKTNEFLRTL